MHPFGQLLWHPIQKGWTAFLREFFSNGPLGLFASIAAGIIPILCRLDGLFNLPPSDRIYVCIVTFILAINVQRIMLLRVKHAKKHPAIPLILIVSSIAFLFFYYLLSSNFVYVRNNISPEDASAPSVFVE